MTIIYKSIKPLWSIYHTNNGSIIGLIIVFYFLLLSSASSAQDFNGSQIDLIDLQESPSSRCCVLAILNVTDASNISQIGLCYSTESSPDISDQLIKFDLIEYRQLNYEEIPDPPFPNFYRKEELLSIIESGQGQLNIRFEADDGQEYFAKAYYQNTSGDIAYSDERSISVSHRQLSHLIIMVGPWLLYLFYAPILFFGFLLFVKKYGFSKSLKYSTIYFLMTLPILFATMIGLLGFGFYAVYFNPIANLLIGIFFFRNVRKIRDQH